MGEQLAPLPTWVSDESHLHFVGRNSSEHVPRTEVRLRPFFAEAQVEPQRIDSDRDGRADEVVRTGNVAWFAGFAPHGRPRIAFAVMVEYVDGSGGANAGPLALDVLRLCKRFGYLP